MKTCKKCNQEKDESCFYKRVGNIDGLRHKCKDCLSKEDKQRYENNREKKLIKSRLWRKNNPGKCAINKKRYLNKKPKKVMEYRKKWRKNNAEKLSNQNKIYRKANREKNLAAKRKSGSKSRETLSDFYIKTALAAQLGLKNVKVSLLPLFPTELIELKRTTLLIKREIKNGSTQTNL